MRGRPKDSRGIAGIVIAVIAVLIVVVVVVAVLAILLIPFNDVKVNEARSSALQGANALNLKLSVNMGEVNVDFVDDNSTAASLTVTGHQRSGLLASGKPVDVTWQETMSDGTLNVVSSVNVPSLSFPFSSNINCTLQISNQLRTALNLSNDLGSINLNAGKGVNLTALALKTSTGGVRASLNDNVTLSGPLRMEASTGGVDLIWTDVNASGNPSVSLRTSTGGVRAVVTQSIPLGGNVSFSGSASLGGVDLSMDLKGNNSARISSHTNLGGVNVREQTGFNGNQTNLASQNYPSGSNFEVSLGTSTGGINLSLRYQS